MDISSSPPMNGNDNFWTSNQALFAIIISFELIVVLFLSTFSEPVVSIVGKPLLPVYLEQSSLSRAGRIIMLYHTLAVPFVVAIAFLFLEYFEVREKVVIHAKYPLFVGAILTILGGMGFAYIFQTMFAHTVFLVGLVLVFYGGVVLLLSVMPTKSFPTTESDKPKVLGLDFEYLNLFLTMLYFVISAAIGGIASSFLADNPAFLAEDIVRQEEHNLSERMVISHLHIMVALLVTGIFQVIIRFSKLAGWWFKLVMLLVLPGSFLISLGAWLVIIRFEPAHMVINVGAMILIAAGFIVAYHGITSILRDYNSNPTILGKIKTLVVDHPLRFTLYFELIWGNFVTTIPGIYVAINLDLFRSDPYLEVERTFNVAHWHILAALIGIATVLMLADHYNLPQQHQKCTAWFYLLGSIVGFGGGTFYMTRSPWSTGALWYILMNLGILLLFLGTIVFAVSFVVKTWNDFRSVSDSE